MKMLARSLVDLLCHELSRVLAKTVGDIERDVSIYFLIKAILKIIFSVFLKFHRPRLNKIPDAL